MKTKLLKSLLTIACLLCSIGVYAHDFEVDGIYYQITAENEVAVTYYGEDALNVPEEYKYAGEVVIPESVTYEGVTYSVTSIGYSAFSDCTGLTDVIIHKGVTSIGNSAFFACHGLTSITIPNSVTEIGIRAFSFNNGLTSIKVEEGNTVYDSRENCNAIILTASNTLIAGCKNTIIPNTVTTIDAYTFEGCDDLTSITIPNSVTSIGKSVFSWCSGLTEITISEGVTSIGEAAFYNCWSLTSITIPNSVTSIESMAFYDCSGMTEITISEGVTTIGDRAFMYCTGLTEITIPEGVTTIGDRVFYGCNGLTSIMVEYGNTVYDSRQYCNAIIETTTNTLIAGCQNTIIPEGVASIGNGVFSTCYGLISVTIPESVTSIGEGTFYNCTGLTEIAIPKSVTSIGDRAFSSCYGLTSIRIEAVNPPTIQSSAFEDVDKSIPVYVPAESLEAYKQAEYWSEFTNIVAYTELEHRDKFTVDGIHYEILPRHLSGQVAVTYYGEDAANIPEEYKYVGEVVIPETVSYQGVNYNVTYIGSNAFCCCGDLTSVVIPSSVQNCSVHLFLECNNLISIVVAEDNTVYDSRENCNAIIETATNTLVAGCINTTIPNSVTSIEEGSFSSCRDFTEITIPASVIYISNKAFLCCYGLTSIKVDEGNTVYDSREGCNAIIETATNTLIAGCKKTIIPNSVTSIGKSAFAGNYGLTEITIPSSVTSIGNEAFSGCTGLTEITIPESVTSIGQSAFSSCYNLTSIRIEAVNPPAIEESTFNYIDKTIPVYVPAESLEAYQSAEYWSEFTNIVAIGEDDNSLLAEVIEIARVDGIMKQEEISLPISLINNTAIAGLQCDIFLPDGLTPVMQGDKYDIVLSSRAEGFDVTAKLRNDGALRIVVVSTDTTDSIRAISGNEGELFTIKLMPNEQYSTDDNIAIRNIVMTGSDYAEYEATEVIIPCTVKESITGDSNRDKKVNVTDLSQMANYLAGNELGTLDTNGADANQDGLVDSADIDAVSDVVVKASKTEAQNNTEVTETTENRLEAEVIEVVKMDGVVVTNPISLPIALTNTATITAIQCDITVPAGLTLVENDDVADITLSERLGDSHVVKSAWLDNGALRVLIYSPTAEGIEGESGTLFTLQLQPNESYEADATIEVKNITMASTDAVEYNAMPLSISCTVKESFLGDVNRDGKVNVTDVIVTIGKVLNVYDGEFDTVAADIDQDGEITIVDVVGIINLVLDEGDTPSQARMQDEYAEGALTMQDVKMSQGETKDLVIGLTNEAPYTAFQMDVTLPAGLKIEHIALSERANGHIPQWQAQADGSVRIVGYALDNAAITGNDGALLTLTVSSDSQFETGEVMVSNTIFSTRQLVSHRLERMTAKVSNITALNDVVTATRIYATDHKVVVDSPVAQEAAISTIDGVVQRVALQTGRNEIPLQQGVYIVAVDAEVKKVVIR